MSYQMLHKLWQDDSKVYFHSRLYDLENSITLSYDPYIIINLDRQHLHIEIYRSGTNNFTSSFKMLSIDYNDFVELTEVREFEYYHRVSYFDDKGKKHLLNEEEFISEKHLTINLQYLNSKDKHNIEYLDIRVDNDKLDLALSVVKRLNRIINNRLKKKSQTE